MDRLLTSEERMAAWDADTVSLIDDILKAQDVKSIKLRDKEWEDELNKFKGRNGWISLSPLEFKEIKSKMESDYGK